jgi:hypothetical protein
MEELMQYVWQHRLWIQKDLTTVDGTPVQVIDPGLLNRDAGPDFFNAKVKIGAELWSGNVELHIRASDWHRHGHDSNPAYQTVILHVVQHDDCAISRPDGQTIPQMVLPCAPDLPQRVAAFVENRSVDLACAAEIFAVPPLLMRDWLDAMGFERLQAKVDRIMQYLQRFNGNWEDAAYVTLARALGAGVNSEPFERLAMASPLRFMRKHSDSPLTLEAMLFGQAGLIDPHSGPYAEALSREYQFVANKFSLQPPQSLGWKMSRMRPQSFPHRRIALLARMMEGGFNFLTQVLDCRDEQQARALFSGITLSGHWATHSTFTALLPGKNLDADSAKAMGATTVDMLVINVVAPLMMAYGEFTDNSELRDRAIDILEHLPAEQNRVVDVYRRAGIGCNNAFLSQALIELRRQYCDVRKCLYCRIGHRLLASKVKP